MKLTKQLYHVLTIKDVLDDGIYTLSYFWKIVSQVVIIKKIVIIIIIINIIIIITIIIIIVIIIVIIERDCFQFFFFYDKVSQVQKSTKKILGTKNH